METCNEMDKPVRGMKVDSRKYEDVECLVGPYIENVQAHFSLCAYCERQFVVIQYPTMMTSLMKYVSCSCFRQILYYFKCCTLLKDPVSADEMQPECFATFLLGA